MIRLIATDLDDTLLDVGSALTARSRAALEAAMAAGCGVAIVSGRMLEATLPFAREISVNAPMVIYNGAMVYDHRSGETLYARRIPFETALGMLRMIEAMGLYVQLYPGMGYFCDEPLPQTEAYAKQIRVPVTPVHMPLSRWLEEHPCDPQKLLLIDTPEGATAAQAALTKAFPSGVCCMKSKPHYLEIMPEGVNKGHALAALAEGLGVAPGEVMAFGDGENDVPMLTFAGAGFAMANGCEPARTRARHIAPPNTEDGVAQVVEQYLRQGLIGPLPKTPQEVSRS